MSARQLETVAIEGRTVLHVNGELPEFLAASIAAPAPDETDAIAVATEGEDETEGEAPGRIKKFVPKPRKVGTGYVTKPGARPYSSESPSRERRPFTRESNRPDRPSFTKPWEEEKADRLAASRAPSIVRDENGEATASSDNTQDAPRPFTRKPSFDREGKRPAFGSRPAFGNKPAYGSKPAFGGKPRFGGDRPGFSSRPPFPREGESGDARPPRKTFSKPGTFDRKREGFAGKSFDRGDSRPPRRDFGDSRPPRRDFAPRPGGESDSRPPRREFTPRSDSDSRPPRRTFGDKPSFGGPRTPAVMPRVLLAKAVPAHPASAASPASPATAMTVAASAADVVDVASAPAGRPSANSTHPEATGLRAPSRTVPPVPSLRIGRIALPVLFPPIVQTVLIAPAVLFPLIVVSAPAVLPVPKVPAAMPVSHRAALELKSPTENRLAVTLENPAAAASPGKSPMASSPRAKTANPSTPLINSRTIKSPSENGLPRVNSNLRKANPPDDASARQFESCESA